LYIVSQSLSVLILITCISPVGLAELDLLGDLGGLSLGGAPAAAAPLGGGGMFGAPAPGVAPASIGGLGGLGGGLDLFGGIGGISAGGGSGFYTAPKTVSSEIFKIRCYSRFTIIHRIQRMEKNTFNFEDTHFSGKGHQSLHI
jgi:hypothetical protein